MYTWSYVPEGTSPARLLALNALVERLGVRLPSTCRSSTDAARGDASLRACLETRGVVPANEHESLGPRGRRRREQRAPRETLATATTSTRPSR